MRAGNYQRFVLLAVFWAFAAFCCLLAVVARGAAGSALPAQVTKHFAIADFDGDSRPDLARVTVGQISSRITHYWIAFHLSGGPGQTVGFTAPTGGAPNASTGVKGDR